MPIRPADRLHRGDVADQPGRDRDHDRQADHDRRVAEREEEAHRDRPLAVLHQLAGRVVDRRDVVGVDRVAEAEGVGQEGRRKQDRIGRRGRQGQAPGDQVEDQQEAVDREDPVAQGARRGQEATGGDQHRGAPVVWLDAAMVGPRTACCNMSQDGDEASGARCYTNCLRGTEATGCRMPAMKRTSASRRSRCPGPRCTASARDALDAPAPGAPRGARRGQRPCDRRRADRAGPPARSGDDALDRLSDARRPRGPGSRVAFPRPRRPRGVPRLAGQRARPSRLRSVPGDLGDRG